MTRRLSLFGATGSVGQSTLDLIRRDGESWQVAVLTANSDVAELARLAAPGSTISTFTSTGCACGACSTAPASSARGGRERRCWSAASGEADWVMAAIVGTAGLAPTLAAARQGADIALANKETLVCAGELRDGRGAALRAPPSCRSTPSTTPSSNVFDVQSPSIRCAASS